MDGKALDAITVALEINALTFKERQYCFLLRDLSIARAKYMADHNLLSIDDIPERDLRLIAEDRLANYRRD